MFQNNFDINVQSTSYVSLQNALTQVYTQVTKALSNYFLRNVLTKDLKEKS